ncbi:MAG: M48 family metallopeptidase [Candidatus Omnitrophota bacterium]|nr:M48 family metallopeptidase [Candidatus Omnitrophota bacterium]
MAYLRGMLLVAALLFFGAGCATHEYNTATGKEDIIFVDTQKEVNIGKSIAEGIEKNKDIKLDPDPLMTERVNEVGQKIASVSGRKEVLYSFRVIDEDEVNAFALPGGYVFVFKGLVDKVDSDDELAAVIAHEIAHVVARHSIKRLQGSVGYDILRILMAITGAGSRDAGRIDSAFTQLIMSYSREDEALADKMAIKYLKGAGYDPWAIVSLLKKLQEADKVAPIRPYSSYRSHPYVADRIRMVKKELAGEVDFSDYMNKGLE